MTTLSSPPAPAPMAPAATAPVLSKSSLWRDAWLRLSRNRLAVAALAILLVMAAACYFGALISPYNARWEKLAWLPFVSLPVGEQTFQGLESAPPMARVLRQIDLSRPVEGQRARFSTIEELRANWKAPDPVQMRRVGIYIPQNPAELVAKLERGEAVEAGGFRYIPDGQRHWLGNDNQGRDVLLRVLNGGRTSFNVGLLATFMSVIIGVLYGATSGYLGGKLDAFMMRVVDILYALPFTILVILLMTLFPRNFLLIFVAIGVVQWLTLARIVRGQALSIRKMEYVEAAISLGYTNWQIITRHVVPNLLGPVIVYSTLTVPQVMLLESFLSFLGLGISPPDASWGVLISEGATLMTTIPHLLLAPAIAFSLTLFCLNFVGDGLRDALDPKASKD